MQSKTSFFNKTIFWKTVTRFWPIWGFYLAVWLVAMPLSLMTMAPLSVDRVVNYVLGLAVLLGPIGAASVSIVSAMAAWSFLYNARSAHGTACLPVRRESLFVSNLLAGLLPLIASNVVIAVLAGLAELGGDAFDGRSLLEWFAAVNLQLLCFYGIAAFCAMLTGNIVILPILYGVLNLLTSGVEAVVRALLRSVTYGFASVTAWADMGIYGTPFLLMLRRVKVHDDFRQRPDGVWYPADTRLTGWRILIVYAVIGLLLMGCALLLLRRRRMESAGDVVAVPVLKPVFRWCMALGCALLTGLLTDAMFFGMNNVYNVQSGVGFAITLGMLLGAFIGWFAAEMMLKKSFRVFGETGLRGWGGFGICAGVILVLAVCVCVDAFGVVRWTPKADRVSSAYVVAHGASADLSAPEDVADVVALHKSIIANKKQHLGRSHGASGSVYCQIDYTMRSGRTVARYYFLSYDEYDPATMTDARALQALLNRPDAVAARKTTAFPLDINTIYDGGVRANIPVTRAAELAGYDDPSLYLLVEHGGYTREDAEAMSPEQRAQTMLDIVRGNNNVVYNEMSYVGSVYYEHAGYNITTEVADATAEDDTPLGLTQVTFTTADGKFTLDLEHCYVSCTWNFTPAELNELYQTCILPDIAECSLGRVWIIQDEEYRQSVYDAGIFINARQPRDKNDGAPGAAVEGRFTDVAPSTIPAAEGYRYASFETTPTVDAKRTADWLIAHGVELYTLEKAP